LHWDRAAPATLPNSDNTRSAGRNPACQSYRPTLPEWHERTASSQSDRTAHIAPRDVQCPTLVEPDFAHPRLAIRNWAAVPTGVAAHSVTVERLAQLGGPRVHLLVDDFLECGHGQDWRCLHFTAFAEWESGYNVVMCGRTLPLPAGAHQE